MKVDDIQKIHEAGLISTEQRDSIIAHFGLKEDGNRFLVVISFLGGILVTAGTILLISAHWNSIPRAMKIAAGLALMLGSHGGGWWLREIHGKYRKTGEALQFIGSALFLANIALIGQIYHIESRTPNAFLLWLAGIAALPWLLRSRAQFVLVLIAMSVWFGCEINQADSLIYLDSEWQILAYALLGLNYVGIGYCLRRTAFADFATVAEKAGFLGLLLFAYPLTWPGFLGWWQGSEHLCPWLLPVMAGTGVLMMASGISFLAALTRQWRLTWGLALAAASVLLNSAFFFAPHEEGWFWFGHFNEVNAIATVSIFVFCLLQIQVGMQLRSRFLLNLGMVSVGLDILSAYFGLFGTMAVTGLMFVVTGVFLILFGVYLERKRRQFIHQIKTPILKEAK